MGKPEGLGKVAWPNIRHALPLFPLLDRVQTFQTNNQPSGTTLICDTFKSNGSFIKTRNLGCQLAPSHSPNLHELRGKRRRNHPIIVIGLLNVELTQMSFYLKIV